MMMPANYSVIAENEMTYVVGGGLLEAIGSVTAPVWGAANVKTFNTNLITLISNSFFQKTVDNTLGVMFGGNWGKDGDKLFGEDGSLNQHMFGLWSKKADGSLDTRTDDMTFGNKVMQVLGMAAVGYTLGTTDAKVGFNDKVSGFAIN